MDTVVFYKGKGHGPKEEHYTYEQGQSGKESHINTLKPFSVFCKLCLGGGNFVVNKDVVVFVRIGERECDTRTSQNIFVFQGIVLNKL